MNTIVPEKPIVLVSGSSGLIGSGVARALADRYRVVGLDVVEPEERPPGVDFVGCDLTDDESVGEALQSVRQEHGGRLASVIHLAAYYDFSGEPSPLYEELTVEGTRRLLRRLRDFDAVEQFVFSSTLLVMHPAEKGQNLDESSPVRAEWEYPQSKLDTEQVIREERGQIPAVILRIAGVYDDDCHSIPIAQQIRRIYETELESVFYPGDRERGQSFAHLSDVVDCFVRTVDHRGELEPLEVFLVGEPQTLSYEDLQNRIGELIHGVEWPTIRVPKAVAKVGAWAKEKIVGEEETFIKPWMIDQADAHYPVDISRAREKLGWDPKHGLRGTLSVMVEGLKRDPKAWYETNKLKPPAESA